MKTKSARLGNVLILLGIILIYGCLALVAHNSNEDSDALAAVSDQLPKLQDVIKQRAEERLEEDYITVGGETYPVELVFGKNPDSEEEAAPDMPVVNIDGYDYIGYLKFPTLSTELPVLADCSLKLLRRAPCCYSGSFYTDNLVICAHNYKSSFGKLKKLEQGDEVCFTDMDGVEWRYKVADVEVIEPENVEEMVSSDWPLSLYTCTYDGSQRLTVRCDYADEPEE